MPGELIHLPPSTGGAALAEGVAAEGGPERVGILDMGSNSVRLVIYEPATRLAVPVFNERITCRLGHGLGQTGRLDPDGVEMAMASLARFTELARGMGVARLVGLGTAALREAADGPEFVARVKRRFGLDLRVLSGAEEARLGARGVLAGLPRADGLFADMGGGSLDLVALDEGRLGDTATLAVGHLRLAEDAGHDGARARRLLEERLGEADWLAAIEGRTLYGAGGSWRGIARLSIKQSDYPLRILDNYVLKLDAALDLTQALSGLGPKSLARLTNVARRRADTMPYAALAMNRLLERARPRRVCFSAYGLREGQLFEMLPAAGGKQDPLIRALEGVARLGGRVSLPGQALADWIAPLFAAESEDRARLRLGAALLSDIGWSEHADYRALHAFMRVLRLPVAGLSHAERIALASAIYLRYRGREKQFEVRQVRGLLGEEDERWARVTGLALRLGHQLSGGVAGLLGQTRLELSAGRLTLHPPAERDLFASAQVKSLFAELAEALGVAGEIV